MKKSKLLIIGLILLTLVCSMAVVSAVNNQNIKINGDSMTFHGVKFNIPKGYHVDDNTEDMDKNNQVQSDDEQKVDSFLMKDDNGHTVTVYVMYDGNYTPQDVMDGTELATINGAEGSIEDLMNSGTLLFTYLYDGNMVWMSGNREIFEQIVVGDGSQADDEVTADGNTLTVHGEKFNIPSDYVLSYKDKDNETTLAFLKNTKDDEKGVMIQVDHSEKFGDDEMESYSAVEGFDEKTLKNIDGIIYKNDEGNYAFIYVSNGSKVYIVGDSEDEISQFIV